MPRSAAGNVLVVFIGNSTNKFELIRSIGLHRPDALRRKLKQTQARETSDEDQRRLHIRDDLAHPSAQFNLDD